MTELKDQLSLLGRKTEYKQDYAPEVLEAFDNKHPENDYWVRFNCPNLQVCVLSRGNRILLKYVSAIFLI